MTDEERERYESEHEKLLALFIALLRNLHDSQLSESLYALSELRTEYLIIHALDGFGISVDDAILLLKAKNDNTLTEQDREKVEIILAAVRNLIEFAVAEEYHLYVEADEMVGEDVDYDDIDEELADELWAICKKYNLTYATVENEDVKYAMAMASWWIGVGRHDYLMYMTQGDDRVRPWHAALEGFTARRDDFPSWMIPPIEWGCRCYLVDMAGDSVENSASDLHNVMAKVPEKPSQLDPIFSESVCKHGRIFSDAHPYFTVDEEHVDMLNGFVERLKEKWHAEQ